jgi:hypothetical protein
MLLVLRSVSSMDKREVSVARVLSEASLVTVAEARAWRCSWRKVPTESLSSSPKVFRCRDGGTGRAGTVVDYFFFVNVGRM